MSHTHDGKDRLLARVRRIRGQVEALEKALELEKGCGEILHLIAASRGAMNSLMAEIVEGHIRYHVVDPRRKPSAETIQSAEDLIDLVHSYLR